MSGMIIALVIPLVLWGAIIALLIFWGRVWFDMLLILVGILLVLILIGVVARGRDAMVASIILHAFLVVYFSVSFTRFHFKEKRGDRKDQTPE